MSGAADEHLEERPLDGFTARRRKDESDERPERATLEELSGWGRTSVLGRAVHPHDLESATQSAVLSRGLGRSYGDSALPPSSEPEVVVTTRADRILLFDESTGRLRAEAGLSLIDLNWTLLDRGWFVPVTPGTQFVTMGGLVAADVHGKNHHRAGCFGDHVTELTMRVADGRVLRCSRDEHSDLFWATIGGMGLTGHILEVELTMERVPSPWIWQETERIPSIDAFLVALRDAATRWPYAVGWIDCLSRGEQMGRGILMCGRWATPEEAPSKTPTPLRRLSVPFEFPSWVLGRATVKAFNELYYRKHFRKQTRGIVHPETFFYPLDAIHHWNRIYGRKGFTQYQCVLPAEGGPELTRRFLELLTEQGGASFLCVIKDFGEQSKGLLSFPMRGTTIALDIPMRAGVQELVDCLNEFVADAGGRIYLAKDSHTRAEDFRRMEPRLERFEEVRDRWDPERAIRSAQSVRLFGDKP